MSIGSKAASGAAWNIATGLAVRAVGLVGTLLLTRFLAPDVYGEVSVAFLCVTMATRFASMGVGPYLIAFKSPPEDVFQALCLHAACAGASCLAVTLVRAPLGVALGSPGMARYVPGMALAIFISQISMMPSATLMRGLQFRVLALLRAAGEVTYTVVSVALAPLIGGVTIVVGNIARALLVSSAVFAYADRREWLAPVWPRWPTLRRMLAFGIPMNAANVTSTIASSADNLLVSHLYGPTVMGEYNLAYNLASLPTTQISENIGDVLLPSFAKMGDEQRRGALPRASSLMALVLFPISLGLSAVAPAAVHSLLDARWAGVAPMLAVLATLNLPHPLTWVVGSHLAAVGRTRPLFLLGLLRIVVLFGAVLTIGRLSPLWACLGVSFAYQLFGLSFLLAGVFLEKLRGGPLLSSIVRPLLASLVMVAAVFALGSLLRARGVVPGWPALVMEVAVGVVAYFAGCALLVRESSLELIELARATVRRRLAA